MNLTEILMPTHSDLSKLLHTGAAIDPACRALTGGQPDHCRHGIEYATICHECDDERADDHANPLADWPGIFMNGPTPEGLRNLAQGCEARATLGKPPLAPTNPGGVAPLPDAIPAPMLAVLTLVIGERLRQNALVESGILPFNCADAAIANTRKLPVLSEEHGEVGKALYELTLAIDFDDAAEIARCTTNLRTELIQVAAVAVAWAESLTTQP